MATKVDTFSRVPRFRVGQRLETSGQGRTARWPQTQGTVTRVRRNSVIVRWDGTSFEDEMELAEVRSLNP